MSDIESFREKIQTLIEKFEKDKSHYLSKGYPEAQVRIDFINPFFKALGWDIENKAQKPPHERDVLVELSPEITKRPDYNFRIHGATKFFIEAKAPSVALDDVNHILQAKSYAWSTKEVYFVILTDFEEFKLFDASLKPNPRFPNEGLIFAFKDQLMPKPRDWKGDSWKGRKPGSYKWYEIQDAMEYHEKFDQPKIIYLKFQVKPAFVFDNEGFYPNSAVWIIPKNDLYLLGILNSKLGWFLISNYCTQIQNGYQLIFKYLRQIPIRSIDFNNPSETAIHDKLVSLVDGMLELHKKKTALPPSAEREKIEREIAITDEKIDEIVYGLYGITDEERKIIEGS